MCDSFLSIKDEDERKGQLTIVPVKSQLIHGFIVPIFLLQTLKGLSEQMLTSQLLLQLMFIHSIKMKNIKIIRHHMFSWSHVNILIRLS